MAHRPEKGHAGHFARGAEIWMHQTRLFLLAVWTVILLSGLIAFGIAAIYAMQATTPVERYALHRHVLAQIRDALLMHATPMELQINGAPHYFPVEDVIAITADMARDAVRKIKNGVMIGGLSGIGFCVVAVIFWWRYGKDKMTDRRLRGAALVHGEALRRLMQARDDCSPYSLAGIPIRKNAETLHTMIGGAQGTGKSQQFFVLMKQVRARGKRAIIYDPTGEFTQAFYRDGKDILMNPLDARSPHWTIWHEIEKDYHFDAMANGLIPDPAEADPFWAKAGRMVLKDVYRVLGRNGTRTNLALYNAVAKSNLEAMHTLLTGTAGATYVDPTSERTGMSLKMTVQNQLEAFRFLPDAGPAFSIRRWIHEDSDAWMFITARESMREALKPVLSLWIDTAIKAVLDLEPVHQERLWFFIDELPTLQKLDILKLALTNTRKYGLCMVLGVQDFSQLYEIYGRELAKTIISGCQTKLLLRVTDGAAAKLLAELLGQAEVDEKEETLSYGLDAQRDGVSVFARRAMRDIVMTSEILTLPDMHGYLATPGDYPIAHVAYTFVPTEKIAEGFREREGFAVQYRHGEAAGPLAAPAAAALADRATGAAPPAQGTPPGPLSNAL